MRELDYGVGEILQLLKTLEIANHTLVIFSSDNGAATYAKENGEREMDGWIVRECVAYDVVLFARWFKWCVSVWQRDYV